MKDNRRDAASIGIIGGADGPTSVFTAGGTAKKPLKLRMRNYIHSCKRRRAEKKIVAGAHTLPEVAAYAAAHYGATAVPEAHWKYMELRKSHKENLIIRYRPELLDTSIPDVSNADSVQAFIRQAQARSKQIASIPDHEIPMDFHVYEIRIGDDCLEMEIDYHWNVFGVSYSGSKKAARQFRKITQDLYRYYGVSEQDIQEKTERYLSLLSVLSS